MDIRWLLWPWTPVQVRGLQFNRALLSTGTAFRLTSLFPNLELLAWQGSRVYHTRPAQPMLGLYFVLPPKRL